MPSKNKVNLMGRVGQDPEIKYTNSGTPIANLSIATTYKPPEGDEQTEWHRVVAFGKTAEVIGEHVGKGCLLDIEGRLQTRDWEDRDGNKRKTTEVVINPFGGLQILTWKKDKNIHTADGDHNEPVRTDQQTEDEDQIPF